MRELMRSGQEDEMGKKHTPWYSMTEYYPKHDGVYEIREPSIPRSLYFYRKYSNGSWYCGHVTPGLASLMRVTSAPHNCVGFQWRGFERKQK